MLPHFEWSLHILIPVIVVLLSAWSFQAYWGMRTSLEAKNDIRNEHKVSEWLYVRFVTPIVIGLVLAFSVFELTLQGGMEARWGVYTLIGVLLLLWPSIFIVMVSRTYELVKIRASKTA